MMTKLGKLLVLLNVFLSIGLLAWAFSIFVNRLGYFDSAQGETTTPGQFTRYANEYKRLNDGGTLAQSLYVRAADELATYEQERAFRNYILSILLDEVKKQGMNTALFREFPRDTFDRVARPEYKGLIDVRQYNQAAQFPPRKGLDNTPLEGYGQLQRKLTNLVKDEVDLSTQDEKILQETGELSKQVYDETTKNGLQTELFKLQTILKNLDDESDLLADSLDNWEEQLRTMKIRKQQLAARLAEYQK